MLQIIFRLLGSKSLGKVISYMASMTLLKCIQDRATLALAFCNAHQAAGQILQRHIGKSPEHKLQGDVCPAEIDLPLAYLSVTDQVIWRPAFYSCDLRLSSDRLLALITWFLSHMQYCPLIIYKSYPDKLQVEWGVLHCPKHETLPCHLNLGVQENKARSISRFWRRVGQRLQQPSSL